MQIANVNVNANVIANGLMHMSVYVCGYVYVRGCFMCTSVSMKVNANENLFQYKCALCCIYCYCCYLHVPLYMLDYLSVHLFVLCALWRSDLCLSICSSAINCNSEASESAAS